VLGAARRRQPRPAAHRTSLRRALRRQPIPASSGKTRRYRLNRSGDRQANAALWRFIIVRLGTDQRTEDYLARRLRDGKSKTQAIRCLERYLARESVHASPTATTS
jgi:transposase